VQRALSWRASAWRVEASERETLTVVGKALDTGLFVVTQGVLGGSLLALIEAKE
jgi:hypothetical protein